MNYVHHLPVAGKAEDDFKDPKNPDIGFLSEFINIAGTTYSGLILYRIDSWWRNSKLTIDGYRWARVVQSDVARDLKMDRKTVERAVKQLEKDELVQTAIYLRRGYKYKIMRTLIREGMEPVESPSQDRIILALDEMKRR